MLRVKGSARRFWVAVAVFVLLGNGLSSACADSNRSPGSSADLPQAQTGSSATATMKEDPGVLLVRPTFSPTAAQKERPNVLLITVDTLRADAVGAYGNPKARTPNIDSLAQDSSVFSLAISPEPQTNPTHASIFTGVFPNRHGIVHHMASKLSDRVKPLAELLAGAGYATAGHYSWISFDPEYSGLERGFATYQRHTVDRPFPADRKPDFYEEYLDSKANVTTDGVISWMETGAKDPFFLWIHYNDAHWPYEPPPPFDAMFDQCLSCIDGSLKSIIRIVEGYSPSPEEAAHLRGLYDGEVAFVDQHLGRVFGWLINKGMLDRTLVVLTADHGEGFGEKGLWSHQEVLYNTALRVPLIIRYPGRVPSGSVGAPVSLTDVLPTLLELLGMETPEWVEGKSLLPLMLGKEDGNERAAFSQLWDARKVAVTYQGHKLIKNRQTGAIELYDLSQGFLEGTDLAGEKPGLAQSLEALLDAWAAGQGMGP